MGSEAILAADDTAQLCSVVGCFESFPVLQKRMQSRLLVAKQAQTRLVVTLQIDA